MARAREIRDLKIDEVSLVDKGANQHAKTVIAKRHEETTVEKYYDETGALVDINSLSEGDVVFDEDGQAYEFTVDEDGEDIAADEATDARELAGAGVAKSAFHAPKKEEPVAKSLAASVREELSKALTDEDRDAVISKALGKVDELVAAVSKADEIAKAERDLRLEREYTEIAKSYNVPVRPDELGKVLKRLAETLTLEEQQVIQKCLEATTASQELFQEYGNRGGGDNVDILTQVDTLIDGQIAKSDSSREEMVAAVFDENPEAYDNYLASRSGR